MVDVNKAAILEWVEALESGRYPQGSKTLARHVQNGSYSKTYYCCLGVACELFAKRLGVKVGESMGRLCFDGETSGLPIKVADYLGFSGRDVAVHWGRDVAVHWNERDFDTTLIMLNDTYGKTFPEIAAVLRANFLEEDNHG